MTRNVNTNIGGGRGQVLECLIQPRRVDGNGIGEDDQNEKEGLDGGTSFLLWMVKRGARWYV